MIPPLTHVPGPAPATEPPAALIALADALVHPAVVSAGISTTSDGRWALYVVVPRSADVPIPELEALSQGFPVVYRAAPKEPIRALARHKLDRQ